MRSMASRYNEPNYNNNSLLMKFFGHNWSKEYEQDFYKFLCIHEASRKENYMFSPQLAFRPDLIQWMKDVCKKCNLSILTLHLAAFILDCFMDRYAIEPFRLRFIAAASISIAAKFEENSSGVPSYGKMYSINNPSQQPVPNPQMIGQIEWKIFKFMNCNLHIPTAAHFVYYFLVKGLQESDFVQRPDLTERELRMHFRDILQQFLDNMLDDLWTLKIPPSWMASASLIYARRYLRLYPEWPHWCEELSHLTVEKLKPAFTLLDKYHKPCMEEMEVVTSPNDSGYSSINSPEGDRFLMLGEGVTSPPEVPFAQERSPFLCLEDNNVSNDTSALFVQPIGHNLSLFSQETIDMASP